VLAVKIGTSHQIVIPKVAYAALGLAVGDYLEVAVEEERLVLTPKTLVSKAGVRGDG
jgi:AbrB family looped-hinge helix DNA binding protein